MKIINTCVEISKLADIPITNILYRTNVWQRNTLIGELDELLVVSQILPS